MRTARIVLATLSLGLASFALTSSPAEAGKKAAEYAAEPKILDCGIAEFDTVFKEAATIQTTVDSIYTQLTTARTNANTALGAATDAPFSTALADLQTKAGGKLSVAMEGTMPKIKTADAVPANVQTGIDSVNGLVDAGKKSSDDAISLKDKVTTLGKSAAAFPMKVPTMLGSLTADQVKTAPKIVGDNAKAIKNLATNIEVISTTVTGIFTDITNAFKAK